MTNTKRQKNEFKPFSDDIRREGSNLLQNYLKSHENELQSDQIQFLKDGFVNLYCKMQIEIEKLEKERDDWKERAIKAQSSPK